MIQHREGLVELKRKLLADKGFHAELYKEKCLLRRIEVRLRVRGLGSFVDYMRLLDEEPDEYERLLDTLTINVTKFFRNSETWDVIRSDVIPKLLRDSEPTRVWSAGCASGEEAYSVSILLREWAEEQNRIADLEDVRIVGTDIDRRSLITAERASFPEISFEETPPEVRDRWFHPGPPYRLRDEARQGVSFEHADLISSEPPRGQAMILCRNVIIYFDRSVQEQIFRRFYDALRPGGFLVLGRVETLLGVPRSLFRPVSLRQRIYMKPA